VIASLRSTSPTADRPSSPIRPHSGRPRVSAGQAPPAAVGIPKLIWLVWLQGILDAPETVRACIATWRKHNPGWEIRTLTRRTLPTFLGRDEAAAILRQNKTFSGLSHDIRIALLKRHGGVWADATLYCLKPLDQWLGGSLKSGFFAFRAPGDPQAVSPSFIAAAPGNPVISAWDAAMRARPDDITPLHADDSRRWLADCFADACEDSPACAAAWMEASQDAQMPTVDASVYFGPADSLDLADKSLPFLRLPFPANEHVCPIGSALHRLRHKALSNQPPPFS
jgi:hypothetical protein